MLLQIGILGDFKPGLRNHQATNDALRHAADAMRAEVSANWMPTACSGAIEGWFWRAGCDPGGPRQPLPEHGRHARGHRIRTPLRRAFSGHLRRISIRADRVCARTCSAGRRRHRRERPNAAHRIITPGVLPRARQTARGTEAFRTCAGSRSNPARCWRRIYDASIANEEYFCNFEVNAEYVSAFEADGMTSSAFGEQGELRAVELPSHPFFVATLFQPQLGSTEGRPASVDHRVSGSGGKLSG